MVEGVRVVLVAGEAAERAAHVADVREVDVAADDEGDVVAAIPRAREVRGAQQGVEVRALGAQQHRVGLGQLATLQRAVEDPPAAASSRRRRSVSDSHAASTSGARMCGGSA